MKLTCDAHKRRVMVLNNAFHHRTGDMTKCEGTAATIGTRKYETDGTRVKQVSGSEQVDLNRTV